MLGTCIALALHVCQGQQSSVDGSHEPGALGSSDGHIELSRILASGPSATLDISDEPFPPLGSVAPLESRGPCSSGTLHKAFRKAMAFCNK